MPELAASTLFDTQPCLSTEQLQPRHVLACVDGPPFADAVLSHAATLAKMFNARLTVMHVLDAPSNHSEPMDPVAWSVRHCDTSDYLNDCMLRFDGLIGGLNADAVILVGHPAQQIIGWAQNNGADLLVLGRGGANNFGLSGLGDTARRLSEHAKVSVLLVPPLASAHLQSKPSVHYRKLLMPLDGSARSECALVLGLDIAAHQDAQLLLVHVLPRIELLEANQHQSEVITLCEQLRQHNENAARQYLANLHAQLPPTPSITRLLPMGDARRALAHTADEENADLVVLAAAGNSGYPDITLGSVANYLINRLMTPVLLVRQGSPKSHHTGGPPQRWQASHYDESQDLRRATEQDTKQGRV